MEEGLDVPLEGTVMGPIFHLSQLPAPLLRSVLAEPDLIPTAKMLCQVFSGDGKSTASSGCCCTELQWFAQLSQTVGQV